MKLFLGKHPYAGKQKQEMFRYENKKFRINVTHRVHKSEEDECWEHRFMSVKGTLSPGVVVRRAFTPQHMAQVAELLHNDGSDKTTRL